MEAKQYGILAVIGIAGTPPECDEAHLKSQSKSVKLEAWKPQRNQ